MKSSKEYQHVINIVHHNTTPKQEPMVHQKHVVNIGTPTLEPDTIRSKLRRAVERDDLIGDGKRYVSVDADRLDCAIDAVVEHVPVDQTLLGKLNTARMRLD